MKILHVVSYCLLSALCVVESAVVNVKEVVGGQVKIKCSHTWAGDNDKYFCKRKCNQGDLLVQTKGSKHYFEKERYTIEDLRNGVFYVTIKNLRKSDSGTYWCGVGRYGPDTFQEATCHISSERKANGDCICGYLFFVFQHSYYSCHPQTPCLHNPPKPLCNISKHLHNLSGIWRHQWSLFIKNRLSYIGLSRCRTESEC
ncbi:unnamed protein product, partial [Coregonus sp. 'balchen']